MHVTIVRHALAGDKRRWTGPDRERPLDPRGESDAAALAAALTAFPIRRLVSSPTRRCVQSLQPLAAQTSLVVEHSDHLRKVVRPEAFHALVTDDGSADAVLCTHGEVMRPLLRHLRFDGVAISTDHPHQHHRLLAKGSAWRLTISDGGLIEHLLHIVPDTPTV